MRVDTQARRMGWETGEGAGRARAWRCKRSGTGEGGSGAIRSTNAARLASRRLGSDRPTPTRTMTE
eukprot:scaffold36903_cov66-Phaeocystis_antarctica.AAC.3